MAIWLIRALALVIMLVWVVRLLRLVRDPEWMRPATGAPLGRPREILWLASILGILAGLGVIAFTFLVPLS
jgi:hypothetical protein